MNGESTIISRQGSGLFLALEGPDGSGKTTQAARLVAWLRGAGLEVVACRDPGGTPLGDRLRSILLDRDGVTIGPQAEMLLYMASRAQLIEEVVRPNLNAGRIVVSDRYMLSNVVYQGYAGGLSVEEVWRVGHAATGGILPDLTLLIDVPPEVAHARIGSPRDRLEDRSDAFRRLVREGYLRALEDYPSPIVLVDGSADPETVALSLQTEVAHAMALGSRS